MEGGSRTGCPFQQGLRLASVSTFLCQATGHTASPGAGRSTEPEHERGGGGGDIHRSDEADNTSGVLTGFKTE